ncbi:hypothetical protein HGRIS_013329 [Hohenbuehelia grisea]|uniref:RNA-binding protein n=1 Tax=Hohenbuehelia grisea TaxID=104357 RepID=A0ABR3IV71_9AGAR
MRGSSGPGKDGSKGMRRIILIKDKVTMASYGVAFVEFVDVESAARVLAATMSPQVHPNGFRISDKPVAASFAHPDSFQITNPMSRDEACLPSSMTLGGMEGGWVRYWDDTSTIAMLEFKVEEPAKAAAVQAKEKEKKKKPKVDPAANAIAAPSVLPISDKPVTLSFSKGLGKTGASAISRPISLGFSLEDVSADASKDDEGVAPDTENDKTAAAKKVGPLIASKKTFNNINKWNQVQEELSHPEDSSSLVAKDTATATPPAVIPVTSSTPPQETDFEFSDLGSMACLLCARQFKTIEQLKRHNKESDLHKKNFQDANLREIARQKVLARLNGNKLSEQPKYRDRASERRTLFNQPDVPVPEKDTPKASKKRFADGPPPPPSPPPPPVNPGKDESNVGNKLLKMMGWTEGTGLGTTGEGRVDPIQTAIYAQGAGLGASKGKEVGKYQEGYQGFVQKVQDTARERYNN